MVSIRGVYEVAIRVKDLARAEDFYKNILGFQIGLRDEGRRWLFLRVNGAAGMVVLQEDKGTWPAQHLAFMVEEGHLDAAAAALRRKGVATGKPVHHAWIPAQSVYFSDPDGHELELCAPLRKKIGERL